MPGTAECVGQIKASDGVGEITHEISPPKLSIRNALISQFFLFTEDVQDVSVFEFSQFAWARRFTGLEQFSGPQKASDMVSFVRGSHWLSLAAFDAAGLGRSQSRSLLRKVKNAYNWLAASERELRCKLELPRVQHRPRLPEGWIRVRRNKCVGSNRVGRETSTRNHNGAYWAGRRSV